MLTRINNILERVLLAIVGPVFGVFIVAIFIQVVARNWLQIAILWPDELSRMCFLWTVMIGAAIAVRRQVHYEINIFPDHWFRFSLVLKIFGLLISVVFILVMLYYGAQFTSMSVFSISETLELPWSYIYVSMPFAAAVMLLFWLEIVLHDLRSFGRTDVGG